MKSWKATRRTAFRTLVAIAVVSFSVVAAAAAPPKVTSPRLYILDCGTIAPMAPKLYDVFGDGTVVVKTAPGHTPGHQMLFLKLKKFGPLLLMGDLYHFPEERTLDRVPTFDFDAAMTRATRKKVEQFIKDTKATAWIQHDPPTYASVKKAPQFYD